MGRMLRHRLLPILMNNLHRRRRRRLAILVMEAKEDIKDIRVKVHQ